MMAPSTNTRWSLVQTAKGATPEARAALSELCEIYYAPVFQQIQRWTNGEDAWDHTQEFFAQLLARGGIAGADEKTGRFRHYLHGAVRHFLLDAKRARETEKRGGNTVRVHESFAETVPGDETGPDAAFDRAWACATLKRTLDQLEAEMIAANRGDAFSILKPWLAGDAAHGETGAAAATLGISETAVRVQISRLRKRMRALLEQTLAETLAPNADVNSELRHLLAALG